MRFWNTSGNSVDFDAYEAANPGDPVPADVKTKVGGNTYDNTFLNLNDSDYNYQPDNPQDARVRVMKYAGRYWGGDLRFEFFPGDEKHVDDPMQRIQSALEAYQTKLVSIQGIGSVGGGDPIIDNCEVCGNYPCTCEPIIIGSSVTYNFSVAPFNTLSSSNFISEITAGGLTFGSGSNLLEQNASSFEQDFTHCIRTNGAASATQRYIVVPLTGPATVTVIGASNNNNATSINITSTVASTTSIGSMPLPSWSNSALGNPTFKSTTAQEHTIVLKAAGSARIYLIKVDYDE